MCGRDTWYRSGNGFGIGLFQNPTLASRVAVDAVEIWQRTKSNSVIELGGHVKILI